MLYDKSRKQALNKAEKEGFNIHLRQLAERVLYDSDVVVCTIAQLGSDLLKDEHFYLAVIDEASSPTAHESLQVAVKADDLIIIGDNHQLGPTLLAPREANVFTAQLEYCPFKRMIDGNYPQWMLSESMRPTSCLMSLADDLFYGSSLVSSRGRHDGEQIRTKYFRPDLFYKIWKTSPSIILHHPLQETRSHANRLSKDPP